MAATTDRRWGRIEFATARRLGAVVMGSVACVGVSAGLLVMGAAPAGAQVAPAPGAVIGGPVLKGDRPVFPVSPVKGATCTPGKGLPKRVPTFGCPPRKGEPTVLGCPPLPDSPSLVGLPSKAPAKKPCVPIGTITVPTVPTTVPVIIVPAPPFPAPVSVVPDPTTSTTTVPVMAPMPAPVADQSTTLADPADGTTTTTVPTTPTTTTPTTVPVDPAPAVVATTPAVTDEAPVATPIAPGAPAAAPATISLTPAVTGATTVHTGEPFAGSRPFVVVALLAGFSLMAGGLRRRRPARG